MSDKSTSRIKPLHEATRNFHPCICRDSQEDRTALSKLMAAIEKVLPQQKRQMLHREWKQRLITHQRGLRGKSQSRRHHVGSQESDPCFGQETHHSFADLPRECITKILSLLDPISIGRASATCAAWKSSARCDSLWRPLLRLTFGERAVSCTIEDSQPVSMYRRFYSLASSNPELLQPWRCRRICVAGSSVRWLAEPTWRRILASPGPAGISWNRSLGICFLSPDEVCVWLLQRENRVLDKIISSWKSRTTALLLFYNSKQPRTGCGSDEALEGVDAIAEKAENKSR
jgi:hypothetical protein